MVRFFALACVLLAGMVYGQESTTMAPTEAPTTAAATTAAPTMAPTTQKPTEAPTTMAPTTMGPTTPKPDFSNKFVLTNATGDACVVFIAEYFNVTAMDCDGISGSWLLNHTDAEVQGECENDYNFMKILFAKDNLQVWFNFTKTGSSNNNFHIGQAWTAFGPVAKPTCVNTLDKVTADMRAPDGNKYRCNADKSIVFANSTIYLNHVQLQAFHQGKSTDISSVDEYICMEDSEVSNIVPIAVGCALAGLIVIVLIAYIIGRLRRRPYEPV